MTPYTGFASNADHQALKILHLINLFNSHHQEMVRHLRPHNRGLRLFVLQIQEAITSLITTQGFMEVLWRSLFRPIAMLPGGCARLADLYPEAIQTLTGFLSKGIVGVLITLVSFNSFHPYLEMPKVILLVLDLSSVYSALAIEPEQPYVEIV